MAKEYIVLEPKNKYGNINLNKSVFSSIALNVIEEDENVKLVEGNKPFKGGIVTKIDDNQKQPDQEQNQKNLKNR